MEEKVTFKSFFSTVWRGFIQVLQWFGETLGLRGVNKYTKVLRHTVGTCIALWIVMATVVLVNEATNNTLENLWFQITKPGNFNHCRKQSLSQNTIFYRPRGKQTGFIYNVVTGKKTLKKVDWVVAEDVGDSLAVYRRNGLRGYLNTNTGEVVIPEKYQKAWIFSEGLAAVQKDDQLIFIDREGNEVLKGNWRAGMHYEDPIFDNGSCIVVSGDTYMRGMINKEGEWVIEPKYHYLYHRGGIWQAISECGNTAVYNEDFELIMEGSSESIDVNFECIMVQPESAPRRAYDYEGNLVNDCVISSTSLLWYTSGQETKIIDGEVITTDVNAIANRMTYSTECGSYNYRYGLMDKNGRIITEPLYSDITAIGANAYLCEPHGVIIDDNGNILKQFKE